MNEKKNGLTAQQLEELESDLLRTRERLEGSMKITGRAARPVKLDQTSVGRLSRIDALQNQQLTKGLQVREAARHALVVEALQRIEEGRYGLCAGCETTIPFQRLQVFPETLRCASCGPTS